MVRWAKPALLLLARSAPLLDYPVRVVRLSLGRSEAGPCSKRTTWIDTAHPSPRSRRGTEAGAPTGLSGQRRSREPQGLSDAPTMLREEYWGPAGRRRRVMTAKGPSGGLRRDLFLFETPPRQVADSTRDWFVLRPASYPARWARRDGSQLGREAGLRELPRPVPHALERGTRWPGWGGVKTITAARPPPSAPRIQTRG